MPKRVRRGARYKPGPRLTSFPPAWETTGNTRRIACPPSERRSSINPERGRGGGRRARINPFTMMDVPRLFPALGREFRRVTSDLRRATAAVNGQVCGTTAAQTDHLLDFQRDAVSVAHAARPARSMSWVRLQRGDVHLYTLHGERAFTLTGPELLLRRAAIAMPPRVLLGFIAIDGPVTADQLAHVEACLMSRWPPAPAVPSVVPQRAI
jgi:hypothetical protein